MSKEEEENLPPKILLSEISLSKRYEIPKEPMRAPIMYLALPPVDAAIFFFNKKNTIQEEEDVN